MNTTPHGQEFDRLQGGDGEYHRHWQEVTSHLPISEWYIESGMNPKHCHLDYPLITGYFHKFIGTYIIGYFVPSAILPSTVNEYGQPVEGTLPNSEYYPYGVLQSSLFHRSYKYFLVQRITFVFFDAIFFGFSTFFLTSYIWRKINPRLRFGGVLLVLLTPLVVHVDHSNPQVNFLPLAFFILAVRFSLSSHYAMSACFATLALLTKVTIMCVMPPFAVFVLAQLYRAKTPSLRYKFLTLVRIGLAITLTFIVINYPLLKEGRFHTLLDKVFPFSRGLPGQVTMNMWRYIHFFSPQVYNGTMYLIQRARILAISLSLVGCIPPLVALAQRPNGRRFLLSFQLCTLSFFQFNYYFHEKALLFLTIPMSFSIFETRTPSYILGHLLCICSARFAVLESENQTMFFCLIILVFVLGRLQSSFPKKQSLSKLNKCVTFRSYYGAILICFIANLIYEFEVNPYNEETSINIYFLILQVPMVLYWGDIMTQIFEDEAKQTKELQ